MRCEVVALLILISEILFSSSSKIPNEDVIAAHQSSDMVLVGQKGKKIFFISNNTTRDGNWMDANYARCEEAGLQLAKFENREEALYVYEVVGDIWFWVAASLKGQFDYASKFQFEWNDGTYIADGLNFLHMSENWLCISYFRDVLYPTGCLSESLPSLCQLTLP